MIVSSVPTVGSGSVNHIGNEKWKRLAEIAEENELPYIQLLESAGADLSQAFKVFHVAPGPFYTLARLSAKKIPTVCIVFGTCIAGGAYTAGMSDYTIMVKGNAQLALAGSKLVQVATGEISTDEELGSAQMHTNVSGSSEWLANNEYEAISKCRELVSTFDRPKQTVFPGSYLEQTDEAIARMEPYYSADELLGIVPNAGTTSHPSFDAREVIARIVDGSRFFEFKRDYAPTMVTAWAFIYGVPVGIISNNNVVFHTSAQKATHFINLCNQRGCPIIYLHNVTGFMVGKQYERVG